MNKEEVNEKFEKNVNYLRRNVPPDDIYPFAEQTFMACLYFLKRWSDEVNIIDEMARDDIANKWVRNIIGFLEVQDKDIDISLDLKLDGD